MGLISTIQPSELDKKLSEQPKEKISEASAPVGLQPPPQPPIPCPICRSPFYWLDVYGGGPHCLDCRRPPSRSLVRRPLWGIAGLADGPWWWETLEDPPRVFRGGPPGRLPGAIPGGLDSEAIPAGQDAADGQSGPRLAE